jgi:hypothetical protein
VDSLGFYASSREAWRLESGKLEMGTHVKIKADDARMAGRRRGAIWVLLLYGLSYIGSCRRVLMTP